MSTSNNHHPESQHGPQLNNYYTPTSSATVAVSSLSSTRQKSGMRQNSSQNKLSKPEEIDAYAQQLIEYTAHTHQPPPLQDQSGSSCSNIDDSLGSYITNCLRTSLSEMNISTRSVDDTFNHHQPPIIDVTTIPDYESFCELIQEHCQLPIIHGSCASENLQYIRDDCYTANPIAIQILQKITNVLITQQIPPDDLTVFQSSPPPKQMYVESTIENDDHKLLLPESLWQNILEETVNPNNAGYDDNDDISATSKPSLLVTAISTPNTGNIVEQQNDQDGITNIASSKLDAAVSLNKSSINEEQQQLIQQQDDEEFQQEQHYKEQESLQYEHHDVDEYNRSDIVNMLLQWYVAQDLCYDAAYAATCMAHNNVILAQYMISSAFTQMPICKSLLNDGKCYRADCTFNHNIDHHTCVFWMKSRGCSKRDSAIDPCRYLHGFSPKLLEDIPEQIQIQAAAADHSHNSTITPYRNVRDFYATSIPTNNISSTTGNIHHYTHDNTTSNTKSFANIASQGYTTKKSYSQLQQDQLPMTKSNSTTTTTIQQALQQLPNILIPQNLWHAHENRNASAFYISDPLERYYTVSATIPSTAVSSKNRPGSNDMVVDLHFQSIKTFPVVLDTILPDKLSLLTPSFDSSNNGNNVDNTNGIWIVTGTGHHVNTQRTHQKGGSTLETAVLEYLISKYVIPSTTNDNRHGTIRIYKGRDRNGKGGAIFLQRKN